MENITFALPQNFKTLQSGNLGWEDHPYQVKWPFEHVVKEKQKILYLHFRNTYDHQTWQRGIFVLGDPTYTVMWLFLSRDYVTNEKLYRHFHQLSPNLVRWWLWIGKFHPPSLGIFWSGGFLANEKPCICTSAKPMVTKPGRLFT